ncbi:MAG: metallophosphoesterase [Alkalispirochaeta sp.]
MSTHTIVIGDIHGRIVPFEVILEKIDELYGSDLNGGTIALVGDLVDRGPSSRDVVDLVVRGIRDDRLICVLGNHDEMFLQAIILFRRDLLEEAGLNPEEQERLVAGFRFARERVLHHWLEQGGVDTIRSYGGDPYRPETWRIPPEHIATIATLPLAWANGSVTVTHARASEHAVDEAIRWKERPWMISESVRNELLWNRTPVPSPHGTIHVCGHTPRRAPLEDGKTREIDTGCVFGGVLTAYILEEDAYIAVPCAGDYASQ